MDAIGAEKRAQRRIIAAIPIRVEGIDASGYAYVEDTTALEVSRRGLSFLTRREPAILSTLTVSIVGSTAEKLGAESKGFLSEATVVRVTKEGEGLHRVGVRFIGTTLPIYSAEGV